MGAPATDSRRLTLAAKISIGVLLLEQTFLYFSDEISRYKILLWMNALALGVTLLVMAMTQQLGSPERRRFVTFYAVVLGAFIAFTLLGTRRSDYLLIDNPGSAAVEITFDGKPMGSLPANSYAELPAVLGAHHLIATDASGSKLEDADFTLRRPGLIAQLRAVYNIGGAAQYAAVTFDYVNQSSARIVPQPPQEGSHLVMLHHSFDGEAATIDEPFASSIRIKRGDSTRRTHLCHYAPPSFHGCEDGRSRSHKLSWTGQAAR